MKFKPIDPTGLSDRELMESAAQGLNTLHDCTDNVREELIQFRADQARVNTAATRQRHDTAAVMMAMGGAVSTLTSQVGALAAHVETIAATNEKVVADQKKQGDMLDAVRVRMNIDADHEGAPTGIIRPMWFANLTPKKIAAAAVLVCSSIGGAVTVLQLFGPPIGHFFAEVWARIMAAGT